MIDKIERYLKEASITDLIKQGNVDVLFDVLNDTVKTAKTQHSNGYNSGVKKSLTQAQDIIKAMIKSYK